MREKVKSAAAAVSRDVAQAGEELAAAFGAGSPEMVYASEYYLHRCSHLLLPSLALFWRSAAPGAGALAIKNVAFYGAALRALPDGFLTQFVGSAAMLPGANLAELLCITRAVGTPHSAALFARLRASLAAATGGGDAGAGEMAALADAVARAPVAPPPEWPFPHLAPGLEAAATPDAWKPAPGAPPAPFELHPAAAHVRGSVDGATWLFFCANVVLESNVAHFYATGDPAALRRVVEAALPWADAGAALPNAVELVVNIATPLPAPLALREGDAPTGEVLAAIRANVARLALWLLLHHSRRHPAVTAAVAEACAGLGGAVAEPDAAAAAAARAGGAAAAAAAAAPEAAADAARRLKVLPALLHLIATTRLNNPFAPLSGRAPLGDLMGESEED
jgi:hypothetical protein